MYIYQDRIFKLVQNSLDSINVKNEVIRRWWLTTAIRCWVKGGYRQNLLVSSTHSRSDTYFIITYKELSQAGRTALENGEEMFAVAQSNLRMDDMQMMVRWMRNQIELGETDFSNYDYKSLHGKAKRFASDRRWNMMRADAALNTHLLHTASNGATVHALTSTAALEVVGHDLLNCLREEYDPEKPDKVYHGLMKRHSFIGVYYGGRFASIAEVTLWRAHGSLITDEGRGGYELRSHLGRSNNAPVKEATLALNEWLETLGCKEKVRLPYSSTIMWLKYMSSAQLEEHSRENTQTDPASFRRPALNISLEDTDAYERLARVMGISPEVMRGIAAQESATPWLPATGVRRGEFPIQGFMADWSAQMDRFTTRMRERRVELGRRAAAMPSAFAAVYGTNGLLGVIDSCSMIVGDDRQRAPYQPLTVAYTNAPSAPELAQGRNVRNELEARFGNRVAVPRNNYRYDARGNIKLKITYETPGPKLQMPLLANWRAEHAKQFSEWKEKQPKTAQPAVYGGKTAMMRELFGSTSFRFPETGIIRFLPQTDEHFGHFIPRQQAEGRALRREHDLPEIHHTRTADDLINTFGNRDFTVTGRLRPYQQWARDMILGPDPARVEGQVTVRRVKERDPNRRNQTMILDYPSILRFD